MLGYAWRQMQARGENMYNERERERLGVKSV